IDGNKRKELLELDPKSDDVIRPILRGRDINKYMVYQPDLYLLNTHNGVKANVIPPIDVQTTYPAIYEHLKQFMPQIQTRTDKGDHWTNLRNCVYLLDFEKPKIIYPEITKFINFYYDDSGS